MAKANPNQSLKIGFFTMIRDVLVASLNKGQFPLALAGGILLVTIWRIPSEKLYELVTSTRDLIVRGYLLGYLLFFVTLYAWYRHAKWQRRTMMAEVDRMAAARTIAQEKSAGKKLASSRTRKK